MYEAQELNKRIKLQAFVEVVDPLTGYPTQEWQTYAEAFAKAEPLVGREYMESKATQTENSVKFTLRHRTDVLPAHRIEMDGQTYNIRSVINVKSRNRELLVMAVSE